MPRWTPTQTAPRDRDSFSRKRGTLETAVNAHKPVAVSLTSAELNAPLDLSQLEETQGGGIKVQPVSLQIDLEDGHFTAHVIGKIKVGSSWEKVLSLAYTAMPVLEAHKLTFRPVSAQFGKLPLPQWFLEHTSFVQDYFAQLFRNFKAEEELLQSLTSITLEPGNALLEYKPEAKPQR